MERIMLKINAVQKEFTLNPSTILEHNKIIPALITNKNNPNVSIVTGSVNRTKTGFTNTLSKPKTIATIRAVLKPVTVTLVMKFAISITNPDVIRILMSSFIFSLVKLIYTIKCKINIDILYPFSYLYIL